MSQITLSNETQSIKLNQDERLIKLLQNNKDIKLGSPSNNNLELTQTNPTINLDQSETTIAFRTNGLRGIQGIPGNDGVAATITVGSTTTGDAGTEANVTNSGTTSAAVLDFTIPKGDKGDQGEPGEGSDKNYTTTFTNSDFIVVNHNLGKYPSVTVINSANDEVIGSVEYINLNTIEVTFIGSFSGRITCN